MAWTWVCKSEDVAMDGMKEVVVNGVPVLLVNCAGQFRAIPPMCPHMEEPLAQHGIVSKCILMCTKHLWSWNLDTMKKGEGAERRLKHYDVKVEDGRVFVNIEGELTYDFDPDDDDDAFLDG